MVKEFHANLIDQVELTSKVRDVRIPFNRDVFINILGLRHENSNEWRALQAEDITRFLTGGRATWQPNA